MTDRPNILYVFADQMRASALGCMQDEPVQTPTKQLLRLRSRCFVNLKNGRSGRSISMALACAISSGLPADLL